MRFDKLMMQLQMNWLDINNLRHDVLASRDGGRVTIEFSERFPIENPLAHANQVADGLAAICHFRRLGAHWTWLSREQADVVLTTCLHEDLVLHKSCMTRAQAQKLVGRILPWFDDETVFLSNVGRDIKLHKHDDWHPLTDSHFDSGLVLVSRRLAGIIWFEDQK